VTAGEGHGHRPGNGTLNGEPPKLHRLRRTVGAADGRVRREDLCTGSIHRDPADRGRSIRERLRGRAGCAHFPVGEAFGSLTS
jgi:hypothetical protein